MIAEKLQLNAKYTVETTPDLDTYWVIEQLERVLKNNTPVYAHTGLTAWTVAYRAVSYTHAANVWLTKEGKLPKRIAKSLHENYSIKLDNDTISNFGELLRRQVQKDSTHYIDLTTTFDWQSGDFGDEGSCFWTYNEGAKQMIYDAGGFAIREFTDDTYTIGIARCWCIPEGNVYYIFNCYPKSMRLESFAAMLVKLTGFKSRPVEVCNWGSTSGTLYLNSGNGIAIYPEDEEPDDFHDFKLEDISRVACYNCGDYIDNDEAFGHNDHDYCECCYNELFSTCENCGEVFDHDDVYCMTDSKGYEHWYCEYCGERKGFHQCASCNEWEQNCTDIGVEYLCSDCLESDTVCCDECGELLDITGDIASLADAKELDGKYYCEDCYTTALEGRCEICHHDFTDEDEYRTDEKICLSCQQKQAQRRDGYVQPMLP